MQPTVRQVPRGRVRRQPDLKNAPPRAYDCIQTVFGFPLQVSTVRVLGQTIPAAAYAGCSSHRKGLPVYVNAALFYENGSASREASSVGEGARHTHTQTQKRPTGITGKKHLPLFALAFLLATEGLSRCFLIGTAMDI